MASVKVELMKLKEYPLIWRAFQMIEDDSSGVWSMRINHNALVPKKYEKHFDRAEIALQLVYKRRLGDIFFISKEWDVLKDNISAKKTESAFNAVVTPCDDNDTLILKAVGAWPSHIRSLRKVLNDFFDDDDGGRLRDHFCISRRKSW